MRSNASKPAASVALTATMTESKAMFEDDWAALAEHAAEQNVVATVLLFVFNGHSNDAHLDRRLCRQTAPAVLTARPNCRYPTSWSTRWTWTRRTTTTATRTIRRGRSAVRRSTTRAVAALGKARPFKGPASRDPALVAPPAMRSSIARCSHRPTCPP